MEQCWVNHSFVFCLRFLQIIGLVRDLDIIWTETDADLSVLLAGRDKIVNDDALWRSFLQAGFVHIERRDQVKLRIYNDWGFFLDVDVWNIVEGKQAHDTEDHIFLQMITGFKISSLFFVSLIHY